MTAFGTNIDQAVQRIERAYDVRGMVSTVTSYSDTTAVNQILREYTDFGLLEKEYREHSGEKDGSSPYVGYNYAGAADGLRLESVRYPGGRLAHYTYGSAGSDADNLSRLDAIKADRSGSPGDTLASYTYLGLGTVVRVLPDDLYDRLVHGDEPVEKGAVCDEIVRRNKRQRQGL